MRRKPSVLLLSILVHAAALLLLATADVWLPIKNWPVPHEVLAFSDSQRLVRIEDIVLPHPPRSTAPGAPSASSVEAAALAPVVATTGIVPESGPDCCPCVPGGIAVAEPSGTGIVDGIGAISAPPPPPPQQPVVPIRPHSGVRAPTKTVHVAPIYPALARASRLQGVVIIEVTIDIRGNVESARILRSIPLLDQAALDAVHEWKFTPTLLNGIAVPIIMTVTVNFTLE